MKNVLVAAFSAALLLGAAAPVFSAENMGGADDASAQPGTDAWITTKVKAELMTTKGVPSTDITVNTNNGAVTLSGLVDSKAQIQKSVAIAKSVKGVRSVDSSALMSRN